MPGNQDTVQHHAARQREHYKIPGQVPEWTEGKRRM